MSHLASLKNLSKSFGSKSLFSSLNLHFSEGDRVAIIGKNGSGKSTLLKILAGIEVPDGGELVLKKGLSVSYVPQVSEFESSQTLALHFEDYLKTLPHSEEEAWVQLNGLLTQADIYDLELPLNKLSGGEAKKVTLIMALLAQPQLLLLDEPTNHLDWNGILWLENQLKKCSCSYVLVSHDRYFLNQVTRSTIEIGEAFENEHLQFPVSFSSFIEKKDEYFRSQEKLLESLSNKARRELDWLRAGVQARTTKSRSRQKQAYELFDSVDRVKGRVKAAKSQVQMEATETGRKTKKLVELTNVSKTFDELCLFSQLNWTFSPGKVTGILGGNGSGKSTLLKVLTKQISVDSGQVFHAENLKVLYFDQKKESLDLESTVFEYLGEGSDFVVFGEQSLHVASYARRFLFESRHFALKISQLSGGEKARLALAKSLLAPCDLLILDEPTNDLDIDSLESLESFLAELNCALILVSHDRVFLSELCTDFLGFLGEGNWNRFASFEQWLRELNRPKDSKSKLQKTPLSDSSNKKKSLSYKEKKDLEKMEETLFALESSLDEANTKLLELSAKGEHQEILEVTQKVQGLQQEIEKTYEYWQELESRK